MTAVFTDLRAEVFATIADRTVTATLVAEGRGLLTPMSDALDICRELGLRICHALPERTNLTPGVEILRFAGNPESIARAEERLIGALAKPSGIAGTTRQFVDAAAGRVRIVCGAWKKLPMSHKHMLREAITAGGGEIRIAENPFVYLDKNFVAMLGGPVPTLQAVRHLTEHRKVIQLNGSGETLAESACHAAEAGADTIFIDTGQREDINGVSAELRRRGLRDGVEIAFAGGITLSDIGPLAELDVDAVDIGRGIIDAPIVDMSIDVIDIRSGGQ